MLARPPGAPGIENGKPRKPITAAAGRCVRSRKGRAGTRSGTWACSADHPRSWSARDDGINWAALFNCDADRADKELPGTIDPLLHQPADRIKDWPGR